jgi:hypothetical protein
MHTVATDFFSPITVSDGWEEIRNAVLRGATVCHEIKGMTFVIYGVVEKDGGRLYIAMDQYGHDCRLGENDEVWYASSLQK